MSSRSRKQEDNAVVLKSKVHELEGEVSKLKQRLEDLRKAKNSTILKREREVIQVGGPNLGRPVGVETSKYKNLEQKLNDSESKRTDVEKNLQALQNEIIQVKVERDAWKSNCDKFSEELDTLKTDHEFKIARITSESMENKAKADEALKELERLREKLEMKAMQEENSKVSNNEREVYITSLINENTQLRESIERLNEALSVKEAQWLESEEIYKQKIREKWDEKYAKWMSETEKRIEELRMANLVLKECLAKKRDTEQSSQSTSK